MIVLYPSSVSMEGSVISISIFMSGFSAFIFDTLQAPKILRMMMTFRENPDRAVSETGQHRARGYT